MTDIVLEALSEAYSVIVMSAGRTPRPSQDEIDRCETAVAMIEAALPEHRRISDLHKTIAETIRIEMRHEFEGRRDAALAAFEQAHDRLALTLSADERAAN